MSLLPIFNRLLFLSQPLIMPKSKESDSFVGRDLESLKNLL